MSDDRDARHDALEREYETSSLRPMAERRGITWQAMQQRLRRLGITLRSRGGDWRRFRKEAA